ncbi:MAG: hypothetical protein K1X88_02970 [Nannocystaceae bacterium]|nr:hypothetical protein [Nannocystaceae bacterium]
MSSTSAATTAASTGDASSSSGEGDIETGASSETTATESSSSSSSSSSSGASSETGDAPPCEAVIDLQACFQAGCVFGVYDDTGCHAPFDDAQCAAHGDAQTCLEAFCDWDPLRTACSANVTGDCAQIEDPLLCLYSECIPVDGSCYEPGTAPCDALTGTIECVMNLCNWDDLALLCS